MAGDVLVVPSLDWRVIAAVFARRRRDDVVCGVDEDTAVTIVVVGAVVALLRRSVQHLVSHVADALAAVGLVGDDADDVAAADRECVDDVGGSAEGGSGEAYRGGGGVIWEGDQGGLKVVAQHIGGREERCK